MNTRSFRSASFLVLFMFYAVNLLQSQVTFEKRAIELDFKNGCTVNSADINGDGFPDVIAAGNDANTIAWWVSDRGYPPTFTKQVIDDDFYGVIYVYPADADGDDDIDGTGGLDIVAASAFNDQVTWWQNNGGNPVQWTKYVISNEVMGARSVYPVDIEGDGDTDIVAAGLDDDDVSVFYNDGGNPIGWTEDIIEGNFNGAHWVYSMDMDNDTDMDVLAACYMGATIAIWYNDGNNPPGWTKFVLDGNFAGALSVVAGKIDEDDYQDVVAGGEVAADVRVYYNDGTGAANFTRVLIDPAFYGVWPVWVTDLDNDLDIDILSTSSTNDDIFWWDNQTFVTGIEPSPGDPHGMQLETVFPNPFQEHTTIRYSLSNPGMVRVELFSANGSFIRNLFNGYQSSGIQSLIWDGKDYLGNEIPGGLYICRVSHSKSTTTIRLLKRN